MPEHYTITTTKTARGVDVVTGDRDVTLILDRTTVATLEEARKAACGFLDWRGTCEAITEQGGTIDKMDGTVIEVRPA